MIVGKDGASVEKSKANQDVKIWGRTGTPFPGHKPKEEDERTDKDKRIRNQEIEIKSLKLIIADREKAIKKLEAIHPQMSLGI